MDTVIVQLPDERRRLDGEPAPRPRLLKLGPGQCARFGRGAPGSPVPVRLRDPGVSRCAGQITAAEDYWRLSNYSRTATYVVENLEGAGEHIKVAPGRLGAPVPFEFSRVLLPARGADASFKVFAPQHAYQGDSPEAGPAGGERTTTPFALDPTAKYFLVLLALCEPRLRNASTGAVPGVGDLLERLRPLDACRDLTRSAVNYHIDYLASVKLRLLDEAADGGRDGLSGGKREELIAFALRFDLVREEHLALLPPRARQGGRTED
ncbi:MULTISPECIES: serine/threonine protein kinase [unclassified Streptomyces]|uniref:serine/threonine protein kinase n=1 Tax=unclassified Streptomyces TaxID=2593676 RepID=UPI000B899A42|nr:MULTISPECIES: serine/threonine protein kinase [unclassified Streptomyces]MYS22202.1 serine/threonine protein kinase [Streptomyces sp. SID4948]